MSTDTAILHVAHSRRGDCAGFADWRTRPSAPRSEIAPPHVGTCGHVVCDWRWKRGLRTCFACEAPVLELTVEVITEPGLATDEKHRIDRERKRVNRPHHPRTRLTPDRTDEIAAAIRDGRGLTDITRSIHCDRETVHRIAKARGLTIASGRRHPDYELLTRLIRAGCGVAVIKRAAHCSGPAVKEFAAEQGLTVVKHGRWPANRPKGDAM